MTIIVLPDSIRPLFLQAGWKPGRQVVTPVTVPTGHPARRILSEFGGLSVGSVGVGGEECGRSNVVFGQHWPSEAPEIETWSQLLGSELVYLAAVHNGHGELYVDNACRHFELSLIHDAFYFHGASFGEAMERLLVGRRARPMLRPDQQTITLYGEVFTPDHASVYRWSTINAAPRSH